MHITLQFVPAFNITQLPILTDQVKDALQTIKPFTVLLRHVQIFPNVSHPSVIAALVEPHEGLLNVAKSIGGCLQKMNYQVDVRPYRPHVTLGRINKLNSKLLDFKIISWDQYVNINKITLFRSEPKDNHSRYAIITTFPCNK